MPMHRYAATTVVYLHAKNEIYNCSLQMLDLHEVHFKKKGCKDEWHSASKSLACGKQIGSDGEPVWDSQVTD